MPRTPYKDGKEAVSVYKHRSTKGLFVQIAASSAQAEKLPVPSQAAIYDKMISDDNNFASTMVPKNKIAQFLDRGLQIQDSQ